jgi:hypothetical protein
MPTPSKRRRLISHRSSIPSISMSACKPLKPSILFSPTHELQALNIEPNSAAAKEISFVISSLVTKLILSKVSKFISAKASDMLVNYSTILESLTLLKNTYNSYKNRFILLNISKFLIKLHIMFQNYREAWKELMDFVMFLSERERLHISGV